VSRRCTACAHADVDELDAALAEGVSVRSLAERFGLSRSAVTRHRANHVGIAGPAEPTPSLLDPDPGRRALAALAEALEILERAELGGRVTHIVVALRGARASARQVAGLYRGEVSDADRATIESLYERAVGLYSRCRGREGLELTALGTLRGILDDCRAAAGEEDHGEVAFGTALADDTPTREPGVLIPATRLPSEYRDGGVIRLRFGKVLGPPQIGGDFDEPPPSGTNGNGKGHA
jgi:hypothetical protein